MSPFARALGLLLATVVSSQAMARGSSVLVCRYTGEVVDPCACPRERQHGSDCQAVKDQSCCELRTTDVPSVPAVVKNPAPAPTKQVPLAWTIPHPPQAFAVSSRATFVAARQQAPPSTPLYLSIRSLLI